ncbi:MAG: FAD-dependent oxidoreductase [Dehalococcoidales bacterium]|nr:MAG: FAD-dependent oxidoreductase [Dehalococcoidales bacterium]
MEEKMSNTKTIQEAAREVKVCREADVVVVGGGPGGHSAAIAAARSGARTVLVERYGHLGGMSTGGIVIQIPHMSDGTEEQQIIGLTQEWLDRLDEVGGCLHPKRDEIGSSDEKLVSYWQRFMGNTVRGRIKQTAWVDPELLKCVLNDMVEESEVKLFLHSWGAQVIVDKNKVQGIIFESKSGRQAILGKVVIDGTGDGDLLPLAGAEFDGELDPKLRSSMLALVFRLGNCDYQKLCDFREREPERYQGLMAELARVAGTRLLPLPSPRNDVLWVNNWIPNLNCMNVEDVTTLEVEMRKMMLRGHEFMKKNIPTFENSFILDTASQTGTRGGRRLVGEYIVTQDDLETGKKYDDAIAVIPRLRPVTQDDIRAGKELPEDTAHIQIPYRCLVPVKVEGLLVAGRSFSSDMAANNMVNLIPHCIAMGQAAGTAAALAVKGDVNVRDIDIRALQDSLTKQNVPLPGVPSTVSKA